MYKKIDALFSKGCCVSNYKSKLGNKLYLLYFGFVLCFYVYWVFEYSIEFFVKIQLYSLVRIEFGQIPIYWR